MDTATQPKVLVAENDALIAMSLRELLGPFGFDVVGLAATVADAPCLAQNTSADLAIFDVRLAGKRDGSEGAALLRGVVDIPVVFLTGQTDQATRDRAEAVPCAAYLSKPVSALQIVAAVEQALDDPQHR
jgi:DNA-binding NarL/FixJ family response regulator